MTCTCEFVSSPDVVVLCCCLGSKHQLTNHPNLSIYLDLFGKSGAGVVGLGALFAATLLHMYNLEIKLKWYDQLLWCVFRTLVYFTLT